jgi:hypothetical protein
VDVVVPILADVLHAQEAVPVSVHVTADMVVLVIFVVVVFDVVQFEFIGAAAHRVPILGQRGAGQKEGEEGDEGEDQ